MTYEIEQKLRPELTGSERLLWSGMPRQGVCFRASDWLAVPFSLMWGGFAIFWEYSVSMTEKAPVIMKLWGIPFVLIGLYMIVGRFLGDAFMRGRTYYGVTDQRVIIIDGLFNRQVKSLPLPTLSDISLSERSNRSGTITFGPNTSPYGSFGRAWPGMGRRMAPAFDPIDDVRRVYTLIRDAQQSGRRLVTA